MLKRVPRWPGVCLEPRSLATAVVKTEWKQMRRNISQNLSLKENEELEQDKVTTTKKMDIKGRQWQPQLTRLTLASERKLDSVPILKRPQSRSISLALSQLYHSWCQFWRNPGRDASASTRSRPAPINRYSRNDGNVHRRQKQERTRSRTPAYR
jgi:hypothetical protein